jgi:hypothetical protein
MFAQPLVGWSMLSAGHYPIVMFGPVHLPPILPAIPTLYSVLRKAHTIFAYLLFLTFLAHLSAVLFHTLIIRDRLLDRMALWPTRSPKGMLANTSLVCITSELPVIRAQSDGMPPLASAPAVYRFGGIVLSQCAAACV